MGIKVSNLHFAYEEKPILKGINVEFEKGKFYSVLGPNGSGKTTLIRNILRLLESSKGEVFIDGEDIKKIGASSLSRKLSYVPQITKTEFDFSIEDIVSMGRFPYLKRFQDLTIKDKEIIDRAINLAELSALKDKSINKVSGGEAQRAQVARCLAQDTDYIILDEPVNHLDIKHQVKLLQNLKNLTPEKTIISVMHDINLSMMFSDKVILMSEGKIVADDSAKEVLKNDILEKVYGINFKELKDEEGKVYLIPSI